MTARTAAQPSGKAAPSDLERPTHVQKPRLRPEPKRSRAAFSRRIAHRPRLLAGAPSWSRHTLSLCSPFVLRESTRLLIAWNVGAWAYLVLIAEMMRRASGGRRPGGRAPEDENQWALVFLGVVASWAAIAAIVWELGPVKEMTGLIKAGHIALVAATILSAWTFLNVMFALHYAGVYSGPCRRRDPGGLEFPGKTEPGWGEFVYQAFIIGCTFASSDVNVTSTRMRRIVVIQGVVSFFFNAIILALAINIAANLF